MKTLYYKLYYFFTGRLHPDEWERTWGGRLNSGHDNVPEWYTEE